MLDQTRIDKSKYLFFLRTLLFSYVITGGLLLLLAFVLYKLKLKEAVVSAGIIGIYIIATFFAGFVMGKRMEKKKFLWGFAIGSAYFLLLVVVSFVFHKTAKDIASDLFTTFLMCAGSGTLGGMLG